MIGGHHTGLSNIAVSNSPQFWTNTWDDTAGSFSGVDDNSNNLTGSAAVC